MNDSSFLQQLTFESLQESNWDKFVQLFGEKGACGNCWCMFYRLSNADFEAGKKNDANRTAMYNLITQKRPAGILGLYDGEAVAWCAFAPREDFGRIERSRVHKRIDDRAVWSIPCFFIDKRFRRKGISVEMLKAVIRYARGKDIRVIEAYPVIPAGGKLPDAFAWVGLFSAFKRGGFEIADRTSKNRPMVRYYLDNPTDIEAV